MRILQIAPPWFTVPPQGYGGIEAVVSLLTDGLVERGHDVTLLASGGSRTKARLWTVFDAPPSERLGEKAEDLRHCLRGIRDAEQFDVVHDHSGLIGAALVAQLIQPVTVHTLHGDWKPDVSEVYRALPARLRLVAISEAQRRDAPAGVSVTDVVHNGIAVDRYPFDGRPRGDAVAFVGRATPDKGADTAVEVARRLGCPLRMALKVIEPEEHRYWEECVKPRLAGVDADVRLNGSRDAAFEAMSQAVATLVPIRWAEPFGLVMVESMACGTPVVAYARGAANEVVADGRSGVLVPPDDLDAFCDAVEACATLDRTECRDWVARSFSAERMVTGYTRLYSRLLDAQPPRIESLTA